MAARSAALPLCLFILACSIQSVNENLTAPGHLKLVRLTSKYGSDAVAKMIDTFADADAAVHSAVYRCTRNEALERMLPFVRTTLTENYMYRDYRLYHAQQG